MTGPSAFSTLVARLRREIQAIVDTVRRRRDTRVDKLLRRRYAPGTFIFSYALLLLIGIALGTCTFLAILRLQAVPLFSQVFDSEQASVRSDALKVALTTTGGFAVIAGLYVNYRKQRNDEVSGIREQDRIFTERFNASANLLSSDAAAVRLSGVNSLVRLADDSARDRDTCMSTLCAYLRLPVKLIPVEADDERGEVERTAERRQWVDQAEWEVRRTALALVISRASSGEASTHWKTSSIDLNGAVLVDLKIIDAHFGSELRCKHSVIVGDDVWISKSHFDATVSFNYATFMVGISVVSTIFRSLVYFFNTHFRDVILFKQVELQQHLSFGNSRIEESFAFRECKMAGFISFAGSKWERLALFEDFDVVALDHLIGDMGEASANEDTDRLIFIHCSFKQGLRLRNLIGAAWIVLCESTVEGPIEIEAQRIDLRKADLSSSDFKDPKGHFVPLGIACDEDTLFPDSASDIEFASVPPPATPLRFRNDWED